MLNENPKYKLWRYTSKKEDFCLEPRPIMHKTFEMNGKFSLDGLEKLTEGEWKRIHPTLEEHRTDPEETLVYGNPEAIVIISANYETDYHQIDISLKKYSENNIQIIENIKLILENKLEKKITETKESTNLINEIDIKSN
jgi:hypothetical protein